MKKTTNKYMTSNYIILTTGYCALQNLLELSTADFFTSGVYGWNADFYTFNNIAICTGYKPCKGVVIPVHIVKEYDRKAEEVIKSIDLDYYTKKEILNSLISGLITEVLKEM